MVASSLTAHWCVCVCVWGDVLSTHTRLLKNGSFQIVDSNQICCCVQTVALLCIRCGHPCCCIACSTCLGINTGFGSACWALFIHGGWRIQIQNEIIDIKKWYQETSFSVFPAFKSDKRSSQKSEGTPLWSRNQWGCVKMWVINNSLT